MSLGVNDLRDVLGNVGEGYGCIWNLWVESCMVWKGEKK